jgi:Protein of unknown function (DUF1566)
MKLSNIFRILAALLASATLAAFGLAQCLTTHGPSGNPGTWTPDASGEILTYSGNGLQYTKCQLGTSGANCATGSVQTFNWPQALQASVAARVGGFSDWRLPNLQEAVALLDPTCGPALSPAFPAVSAGLQWTSTSYAPSGDGAWYINSAAGTAQFSIKSSAFSVILVRGSSTPAGNFDSLPSAIVTLTPSVSTTSQNTPFDVVASIPTAGTSSLTVSLNIATQPAGPAGSLNVSVACSIPAGNTTCTVSGMELSGPVGQYTLSASTAGGPAGGVIVNASPPINLLAGPTASLFTPVTFTQFAPAQMSVVISQAVASDVTFELTRVSGPTGTLAGTTTCMIPAGDTSCALPGVTFSGYGLGLLLSADVTSGPSIPPALGGIDVDPQPVNITMGSQLSQIVNVGFSTSFNIDVALPIPITMSSQAAASGPAGTFTPATCVIPAGSLSCLAFGNTFSAVGFLFMEPFISTSSSPIFVQSAGTASINIVLQGGTLSAPATVTQFAPFNVTLTLAAGATATTTFTLAQASGPAGTLGGGTTCTIAVADLSCTFTGVTFSGSGPALGLTATATSGPATPVSGALLDVTAVTYTISPIAPATVQVGVPFSVTFQSTVPVGVAIPLNLVLASGPAGSLSTPNGCTIPVGATSCTITGATLLAPVSVQVEASNSTPGLDIAYERAGITAVAAPLAAATPVPSMGAFGLGLLAALVAMLGLGASRGRARYVNR